MKLIIAFMGMLLPILSARAQEVPKSKAFHLLKKKKLIPSIWEIVFLISL